MPNSATPLPYNADTAPDAAAWRAADRGHRIGAVRAWLEHHDPPWPCGPYLPEDWCELEDELAAGYPPEATRLMDRMLGAGLSRTVAIWALCSVRGGECFRQHLRMTRRYAEGATIEGMEGLFDERDFVILPAAFQASRSKQFGPAHVAIVSHYHLHYAPESSMNAAAAAGFCLGLAVSPRRMPLCERHVQLLGEEDRADPPRYLPAPEAYDRLYEWIEDALFDEQDPIPAFCQVRPSTESGPTSPCGDWWPGLRRAIELTGQDWEAHFQAYPALRAAHADTLDVLASCARPEPAPRDGGETPSPNAADVSAAARRLFLLAHPLLLEEQAGAGH